MSKHDAEEPVGWILVPIEGVALIYDARGLEATSVMLKHNDRALPIFVAPTAYPAESVRARRFEVSMTSGAVSGTV